MSNIGKIKIKKEKIDQEYEKNKIPKNDTKKRKKIKKEYKKNKIPTNDNNKQKKIKKEKICNKINDDDLDEMLLSVTIKKKESNVTGKKRSRQTPSSIMKNVRKRMKVERKYIDTNNKKKENDNINFDRKCDKLITDINDIITTVNDTSNDEVLQTTELNKLAFKYIKMNTDSVTRKRKGTQENKDLLWNTFYPIHPKFKEMLCNQKKFNAKLNTVQKSIMKLSQDLLELKKIHCGERKALITRLQHNLFCQSNHKSEKSIIEDIFVYK